MWEFVHAQSDTDDHWPENFTALFCRYSNPYQGGFRKVHGPVYPFLPLDRPSLHQCEIFTCLVDRNLRQE